MVAVPIEDLAVDNAVAPARVAQLGQRIDDPQSGQLPLDVGDDLPIHRLPRVDVGSRHGAGILERPVEAEGPADALAESKPELRHLQDQPHVATSIEKVPHRL